MEYAWIALTTLAQIAPPGSFPAPRVEWQSTYTNVRTECLAAEERSVEADCKSFGGYRLLVSEAGPSLRWQGRELPLAASIESVAELADDRVEWRSRRVEETGAPARTEWRGFIYKNLVRRWTGALVPAYFAVRLDGERSCVLGEATDAAEARRMVETSRADCPESSAP